MTIKVKGRYFREGLGKMKDCIVDVDYIPLNGLNDVRLEILDDVVLVVNRHELSEALRVGKSNENPNL